MGGSGSPRADHALFLQEQYRDTIANAHNLRRLRLNATLQPGSPRLKLLTPEIAKEWMVRAGSKLRHIAIGRDVFEVSALFMCACRGANL